MEVGIERMESDENLENLPKQDWTITPEPIVIRGVGHLTMFGLNSHFSTEFPSALTGKLAPEEFDDTLRRVNYVLQRNVSRNLRWLICGLLFCCCSFGISLWPVVCLNRRTISALEKTLDHENQQLYNKLGLHWFAGVKHILKGTKSNSTIKQDEITYRNRIFVNEKRLKILRMCNWPNCAVRDECKARFDEIATQNGVFGITRAAALALFSVQGMLSKEYLTHLSEFTHSREFAETWCRSPAFVTNYQRMADTVLNILQKYDGVRVPNYESVCEGLTGDDYLLAIVKFLARRDKIYNRIYNEIFESKMALKDKLAFAAIHMDDDFLGTALERLVERLTLEFPLTTLFVNGLDDQTESHQLLHRYLDLTGDLQTVSLLLVIGNCFRGCAAFREETPNSPVGGVKAADLLECAIEAEPRGSLRRKSLHCFRDYLELLNRWKFWLVKTFICSFLRPKNATGGNERPKTMAVQAVIACTFCGSPIYPTVAERIENLRLYTPKMSSFPRRHGPTRTRTISCLCRKPLPKCMICRKHIGGALEPEMVAQSEDGNAVVASAIDHWVVWCGSCNHDGHLAHVRDWFSEYSMCAVSGCECNCVKRDNQLSDGLTMDASVVGRRGNDWQ